MSEKTASQKAIEMDSKFPHLNNHEIVLELAKIEIRLNALGKLGSVDNSSNIQELKDAITSLENGVIDGLTKQVNFLQDKVKELEAKSNGDLDLGKTSDSQSQ